MKRPYILAAALLATLAVSWWVSGLDDDIADPSSPRRARAVAARGVGGGERAGLALLDGRRARSLAAGPGGGRDLFALRSFEPPPPPLPLLPAPKPVPPTLPFRYIGMLEEEGAAVAFVADGDDVRLLRAGDAIDGRYRVTTVSRARIDFLYLPLNQTQSLATGAQP